MSALSGLDLRTVRAFLDASHEEVATRAEQVCARALAPLAPPHDDASARSQAIEIAGILGRAGLLDAIHPLDLRACALIRERLASVSSLADAVFALQALGSMPIALAGSAELRDRWLEPVRRGDAIAAFVMTESDAGSDVAAISTSARRDGKDYVLTGTKTLISNAGIAHIYCVFASTSPEAGRRGLSCFAVPADTPGVRFVRPLHMSEPHPLGEMAFEDCRLPASARIGEEGEGFALGMGTLDHLRPTVGAAASGMAARALEEALAHASTRRQFGQPLSDFQLVREKLARMATDLAAGRLLTFRAAWEKDGGAERITVEAAMAKAFATEAAQRIVDDAVQIVGGVGVLKDHPVDRLYRAVRALRIYEGTTEIQHLVIAAQLLRGREPKA